MLDGRIHWLGHATVKIDGALVIYIDPFKIENKPHAADLILVTHAHSDHFSAEDIKKVVKADGSTEIVCTVDVVENVSADLVASVHGVTPESALVVKGVTIECVPAYNIGKKFHPKANGWVGYIVNVDGVRVYHAGDTDRIPEMKEIETDIAFLPIGGKYTMDAAEAAEAAGDIEPKLAIPMHFGAIIGSEKDARLFEEACLVPVRILEKE